MKRDQIKIGNVYAAKVSGNVQPVRITRDRGIAARTCGRQRERHDGWDAVNVVSGRKVRIASAMRLRYELSHNGTRWVPAQPKPGNPPRIEPQGTLRDSIPAVAAVTGLRIGP